MSSFWLPIFANVERFRVWKLSGVVGCLASVIMLVNAP